MIGLDTNVLVRFITRDDDQQFAQAATFLAEAQDTGKRCFVNLVVLAELVWTLSRSYRFGRDEIVDALEALLSTSTFEIAERAAVARAIERYGAGKADFSDYLVGELNRSSKAQPTATFDGGLRNETDFQLLS